MDFMIIVKLLTLDDRVHRGQGVVIKSTISGN